MIEQEKIIKNYIDGYNQFDLDKMIADMDSNIVFENIQNNDTNMLLQGLVAFRQQAEEAKTYFINRRQIINSFTHFENKTEIEIEYSAVLAIDLPNGLKKGQELNLKGKSVFEFLNHKIIKLSDIS
jgi:hypothetical protein